MSNYKVVTLCGSTKFKEEFIQAQKELTLQGYIVLTVGLFGHTGDKEAFDIETKMMLDDMHKRKIDLSDSIYVINKDSYIGESTRSEIQYAISKNKIVNYMYIPEYYNAIYRFKPKKSKDVLLGYAMIKEARKIYFIEAPNGVRYDYKEEELEWYQEIKFTKTINKIVYVHNAQVLKNNSIQKTQITTQCNPSNINYKSSPVITVKLSKESIGEYVDNKDRHTSTILVNEILCNQYKGDKCSTKPPLPTPPSIKKEI